MSGGLPLQEVTGGSVLLMFCMLFSRGINHFIFISTNKTIMNSLQDISERGLSFSIITDIPVNHTQVRRWTNRFIDSGYLNVDLKCSLFD